jgi:hypothetical protein
MCLPSVPRPPSQALSHASQVRIQVTPSLCLLVLPAFVASLPTHCHNHPCQCLGAGAQHCHAHAQQLPQGERNGAEEHDDADIAADVPDAGGQPVYMRLAKLYICDCLASLYYTSAPVVVTQRLLHATNCHHSDSLTFTNSQIIYIPNLVCHWIHHHATYSDVIRQLFSLFFFFLFFPPLLLPRGAPKYGRLRAP